MDTQSPEGAAAARPARVIKRYTNRKLYDTSESRYVTLEEIASLVKAGEEVQILDNRTGKDLTEVTLAQILFEEQKKQTTRMPLQLLRDILRSSGESIGDFFQRRVAQPVQNLRDEAERRVDAIVRRSEQTVEETSRGVRELFSSIHRLLEEAQRLTNIQSLMDSVGARTKALEQLATLRRRLEELEARLSRPRDKP